jgi:protein gp37
MNRTSIEWTDYTWNPIRARRMLSGRTGTFCTRISPGCKNCYASVINKRFGTGLEYEVCGGESGPGARPFHLAWAEGLKQQCENFHTPLFMKQLGSHPFCGEPCASEEPRFCGAWKLKDPKGGDMSEWPEHLRVREFPRPRLESVSA